MFGSMLRDFDEDPFFSDMQEMHRGHMQNMQSMMSPGFSPFMALEDGQRRPGRHRPVRQQQQQQQQQPMSPYGMADPFSMMFGNMQSMMQRNFEQMASNPNVHSYSHSSFTSYSSNGAEAPKVYQATSSTRQAPGGVKETQKSVRDSTSGVQRMAVGHHLGDRSHVVQRSRNSRTGHVEEQQDFNNLDETEANSFNNEWRQRTHRNDYTRAVGGRPSHNSTPAITDGRHRTDAVRRDRSPTRPTGPTPGGRQERRSETDRRH